MKKFQILVCKGPTCGDKRDSAGVFEALSRELRSVPLAGNEATVDRYACFGKCRIGVNVLVREVRAGENTRMILFMPTAGPGAYLYNAVKPEEARRIVEEHVAQGRPLLDWTRRVP